VHRPGQWRDTELDAVLITEACSRRNEGAAGFPAAEGRGYATAL